MSVFNSNTFRGDQSLGRMEIALDSLPPGSWHHLRDQLQGGGRGELQFEVYLDILGEQVSFPFQSPSPAASTNGLPREHSNRTSHPPMNNMKSLHSPVLSRNQSPLMSRNETPTLHVCIVAAHNLTNLDTGVFGDYSDPFVIGEVGNQKERTQTIDNNLNPVWTSQNEFAFRVGDSNTRLRLSVWNANTIRGDQSLGWLEVDLNTLPPGSWHHVRDWLQEGGKGELEFHVYLNLSGEAIPPPSRIPSLEPTLALGARSNANSPFNSQSQGQMLHGQSRLDASQHQGFGHEDLGRAATKASSQTQGFSRQDRAAFAENVAQLADMGFDHDVCAAALEGAGGDFERALELLMEHQQ